MCHRQKKKGQIQEEKLQKKLKTSEADNKKAEHSSS